MALVTGIFPSCEPGDIETALASVPNLDMTTVKVVTKSAGGSAQDESPLNFIAVSEAQDDNSLSDDMTRGTGIMSDSGGTSVPGLSGRTNRLTDFSSRGGSSNYLMNLGIAVDQVDNYNTAVDEGRCVVVCQGGEELVAALRNAGFKNVRMM